MGRGRSEGGGNFPLSPIGDYDAKSSEETWNDGGVGGGLSARAPRLRAVARLSGPGTFRRSRRPMHRRLGCPDGLGADRGELAGRVGEAGIAGAELPGVGEARGGDDLGRRAAFENAALEEDGDPVGEALDSAEGAGRDED